MIAVGLKVLKNKLAEYVRRAAQGETVLVTDRDRVVAELVPPREGRSPMLADALLADAIRNGWLTPAPDGRLPPAAAAAGYVDSGTARETRQVQRLRNCLMHPTAQLVYPSLTHNRFEHSIGCLALMDLILKSILADVSNRRFLRRPHNAPQRRFSPSLGWLL